MITWDLARGAGLTAVVLLSAATALGALVSRRGPAARRYVAQYVHRAVAGLGLTALALHVTTILADPFAHVGWRGALVPLLSGYRPDWVAFGTVAAYLFATAAVVGLARGRLAGSPRAARSWRGVHALGYLAWAAAMLHGFTAGSDSGAGWVRAVYVICLAAVLAAVAARLRPDRRVAATPAPVVPARPAAVSR